MFRKKKKKTRLEQIRASAGETLHGAQRTVHEVIEHAPEKLEDLKHGASETLGSAGEVLHDAAALVASAAHNAVSSLGAKAESLKNKADTLREGAASSASTHIGAPIGDRAEAARDAVSHARDAAAHARDAALKSAHKMKREREKQAHKLSEDARRKLKKKKEDLARAYVPEVVIEDSGQKWLWLLVGIGIGAVLGILLAPNAGRRTRANIKDKLAGGKDAAAGLGQSVAQRAQDMTSRASGAVHNIAARHSGEGTDDAGDDVTIADRVRSELGRLEKEHELERINVDSCDGVVTLRGPAKAADVAEALVAAAQGVLGVREVKNELTTETSEESFVG